LLFVDLYELKIISILKAFLLSKNELDKLKKKKLNELKDYILHKDLQKLILKSRPFD